MAQFRGGVKGSKGEATRLGGKPSGLTVFAHGWDIGGTVIAQWNEEKKRDEITVRINGGSNGRGISLYLGTFFKNAEGEFEKVA